MTNWKIGLTGPLASGKGEVVRLLEERGFRYISLSDMVREAVKEAGLVESRETLQNTGNRLRREVGAGVLGARVRARVQEEPDRPWVIDGIRNPAEVVELRGLKGFVLLAVTAPRELLVERVLRRSRSSDPKSEEEIVRRLDRDWGIGEPPEGQQVGPTVAEADHTIENISSLEELERLVENFLASLSR